MRRYGTLLTNDFYRFQPSFANANIQVWGVDPDQNFGRATLEVGDVMPIGGGVVMIGISERPHQGSGQVAASLFATGAAERAR